MDDSDDLTSLSSPLSTPPDSERELDVPSINFDGAFDRRPSPSPSPSPSSSSSKKRPVSPDHELVLADNPDIAFIVMFRSRFNEAFSTKLAHFGPQDIERGVVDPVPSPQVEAYLCGLLGLVMNRKKPVERGHYGRALEEALASHKSEWPPAWQGVNPLSGGRTFTSMSPDEKLTLLRTLVLWALHSSDVVSSIMKEKYKQSRQEGDFNQPLSVHPWGTDGSRRAYWLVEGQDDTSFRVYRERKSKDKSKVQWISVAGSIDELRNLAQKLNEDGAQAARRLSTMMTNAIPRFEATEEKRRRREYRVMRKAQFARPEPGFSLYEGRTRGKRARYTFDDEDEDSYSDAVSTRRSTRHSGAVTPAEPTVTASGRQVRTRHGGAYGETLTVGPEATSRQSPATGDYQGSEESDAPPAVEQVGKKKTRPGWKGWALVADDGSRDHIEGYNAVDAMEEDEDEAMSSGESGDEWDGGGDDEDVIRARDADDEDDYGSEASNEAESGREPKSLIVTLRYGKESKTGQKAPALTNGTTPKLQLTPPRSETEGLKPESMPTGLAAPLPPAQGQVSQKPSDHSPLPSRVQASSVSGSDPSITPAVTPSVGLAKPETVSATSVEPLAAKSDAYSKTNDMAWTSATAPVAPPTANNTAPGSVHPSTNGAPLPPGQTTTSNLPGPAQTQCRQGTLDGHFGSKSSTPSAPPPNGVAGVDGQ